MAFADLQRLRTLALVLDLGSISAAATVLGYTQSAISQQLAALERAVGMPLVDRSTRPLRATPAGAALRPRVDRILAAVAAADAALADFQGATTRLRLAAFPSSLATFVPAAVRDLRGGHPEFGIQVLELETREAVDSLRTGDADLALVHYMPGVALPEIAGLERRHLLVDELFLVLPESHRLASQDAVSFADLEAEALILPRRGTPAGRFRAVVEQLCAEAGFEPQVAYEIDDLAAVKAFIAAGTAMMPMHGLTLATLPPGATARRLTERPAGSRTIEALAPIADRTPAVDDLLERLTHAAALMEPAGFEPATPCLQSRCSTN
jgi:DNA-binding transcriptional LysR family regulator